MTVIDSFKKTEIPTTELSIFLSKLFFRWIIRSSSAFAIPSVFSFSEKEIHPIPKVFHYFFLLFLLSLRNFNEMNTFNFILNYHKLYSITFIN